MAPVCDETAPHTHAKTTGHGYLMASVLYLLGVLKTPQIARTLQRGMEYDPSPPYADVEPLDVSG